METKYYNLLRQRPVGSAADADESRGTVNTLTAKHFFLNQTLLGIAFCFRIIPSFLSDFFLPQIRNRRAEVPSSCDDGGIVSICNMLRTSLSSSLLNTSNQKWGKYSNKASCLCQHSSIREDGLSPLNLTYPEYMSSFQQTWAAQSSFCPADLAREWRTLPNCTKLCV